MLAILKTMMDINNMDLSLSSRWFSWSFH